MSNEPLLKRVRVSKACDICRARKIKCNGENPCKSCPPGRCVYTTVVKPKKEPSKRGSNKKILHELDDRLNRLENLLVSFLHKDGNLPVSVNNSQKRKLDIESGSDSDSDSNDSGDSTASDHIGEANLSIPVPASFATQVFPNCSTTVDPNRVGQYQGISELFSIFNKDVLDWLRIKTGDSMEPVLNCAKFSRSSMDELMKIYSEPVKSSMLTPFPSKEVSSKMLKDFLQISNYPSVNILSSEDCQDLFDRMFSGAKMSYSELLLVNVVLTFASMVAHDEEMELKFLINSIYYYQRVSVVSEGIKTIQGILLLAVYVVSTEAPRVNYMLISTAVRFAQEMSFHRKESYIALPAKDAFRRRRIWWLCYILDKTLSVRTGKPSLILDDDCTTLDDDDFILFIKSFMQTHDKVAVIPSSSFTLGNDKMSKLLAEATQYTDGVNVLISYYQLSLSRFASRIHSTLFATECLRGKSVATVVGEIQQLVNEMTQWRNDLPDILKPGNFEQMMDLYIFKQNLMSPKDISFIMSRILVTHLNYLELIVGATAVALKEVNNGRINPGFFHSHPLGAVYLASVREILTLSKLCNAKTELFYDVILSGFHAAQVALYINCITNPKQSREDCKLLIDSLNWFTIPASMDNVGVKWSYAAFMESLIVKISVRYCNSQNPGQEPIPFDDELLNKLMINFNEQTKLRTDLIRRLWNTSGSLNNSISNTAVGWTGNQGAGWSHSSHSDSSQMESRIDVDSKGDDHKIRSDNDYIYYGIANGGTAY